MWFKDILKKELKTEKNITLHRYKSAKFFLVISSFFFFLNLFFVWASFHYLIFKKTFYVTYIIMLIAFFIYIYFLIKSELIDQARSYIFYIFAVLFFIMFLILLLPIVLDNWIYYFIDLI